MAWVWRDIETVEIGDPFDKRVCVMLCGASDDWCGLLEGPRKDEKCIISIWQSNDGLFTENFGMSD